MTADEMHEPSGACDDDKCRDCPDREGCPIKAMIAGGETSKMLGAKLEGERAAIAVTFLRAAQTLPLPLLLSWEEQVYAMIRVNDAMAPFLNILKAAASKQPEEPRKEPEEHRPEEPQQEPEEHRPEDTVNDGPSIFDRMQQNLRDDIERN